jgi:hypothetical protein
MIIIGGKRPYGRVEQFAGTAVVTTFSHIWFLPIFPEGSYVESASGRVPIGHHVRSIAAGYLRTWGTVCLVWFVVAIAFGATEIVVPGVPAWCDVLASIAVLAAAWLGLGRISRREAAQRTIYGRFAGTPVDVARFSRAQAGDLREKLQAVMALSGRAALSYRDSLDPWTSWRQVALRPDVVDPEYLEAALTLARVELGRAAWSQRRSLREMHALVWKRLTTSGAAV